MRRAGRRVETYYGRGMLQIRSTLHLSARLAVRVNQVLLRSGGAAAGAHLWLASLPFFVLLDVAIWEVLRGDERFGLAWRLPIDMLDVAFWALSPSPASGNYDLAFLIATPLAVEAGVRMGWRAVVVPVALFTSSAAAAVVAGKALDVAGPIWVVMGVGVGAAFYRYCRHLDERAESERLAARAAARRRAFLAGQNQVAMGASSAVDALEGMVPVLGAPEPGSALWRMADGWKTELSATTAREATYLQVALLEWERGHNRHPDLSGLVEVRVAEGQGTTLLGAQQVRGLGRALDAMALRGKVLVRLADGETAALPGRALRLDVGGRPVAVPGEGRAAPPPFDPCVVAYVYAAVLCAGNLLPAFGSVPLPAALAAVAVCALAARASHGLIVAGRPQAQLRVFWIAAVASVTISVLNSLVRLPVDPDGELRLGFGNALIMLSFFGGFYWRTLRPRRWLMPAVVAADILVGILVFPVPSLVNARSVLAATFFNLFPYLPCRHLATALEAASAEHAQALLTVDEDAEHAAFREGRESVLGLVRLAREDAIHQLAQLGRALDADLLDVATHRLGEVDRRLQAIDLEPGLSSSTTTS